MIKLIGESFFSYLLSPPTRPPRTNIHTYPHFIPLFSQNSPPPLIPPEIQLIIPHFIPLWSHIAFPKLGLKAKFKIYHTNSTQ